MGQTKLESGDRPNPQQVVSLRGFGHLFKASASGHISIVTSSRPTVFVILEHWSAEDAIRIQGRLMICVLLPLAASLGLRCRAKSGDWSKGR